MKVDQKLNHSAAHLLAAAVLKIFPDTKVGIGPAIDEGFYYDFLFSEQITDADLPKIEKEMLRIVRGNYRYEKSEQVDLSSQNFKQELLDELQAQGNDVSFYAIVNPANNKSIFTDLCLGPHVFSAGEIKHFKLLNISGSYWRGDSKNQPLTRIYGTAHHSQKELDHYLSLVADRKERDHRKIGKEMEIFTFHKLAGQGFPIWLPNGMIIKNEIQTYIREMDRKYGFREITTPAFGDVELYKQSGHWSHYKSDMFPPISFGNEEIVMRPMTCPHHILVYARKRRSYRELPIRYSEQAQLYRYEKSGALTGLERVRSMVLTEGHIFARIDQVKDEFVHSYKLIESVLKKFAIEIDYVSLSLRDPSDKEKFFSGDSMWQKAEESLRDVLKELNIDFQEKIGEAAFYGPKIDIQVKTALGHEITISTLQLDFLLPSRFDISYIDEDEQKKTPVLIHRGLIGTYERFIATLLEQSKGDLPFWLAPKQVVIIPLNEEKNQKWIKQVYEKLLQNNFRVEIDDRKERLAYKIRDAQKEKAKYQLVLGDKEAEQGTVSVRAYGQKDTMTIKLVDFIKVLQDKLTS